MSTLYIDLKYAGFLSGRLKNFKQVKAHHYKFSHSCEEEKFGRMKARAYIFPAGDGLNVYCHHCGMSHKLGSFIKSVDPNLFQEYRLETFKESHAPSAKVSIVFDAFIEEPKAPEPLPPSNDIVYVDSLPAGHPVREYVEKRKIPPEFYSKIGVVYDFNKFAAGYVDSFKDQKKKYPRLVFPFFQKDGSVTMYSCRAFGQETPKYIKLTVDEKANHIYGSWRVDESKDMFVLEGQIDSLFLDNAISVGSADYGSDYILKHKDKIIIVPDSDYKRNRQVYDSLSRAVKSGLRIALMPESIPWKDINDCVVKGKLDPKYIQETLMNNVFQGMKASLELSFRKRF